MAQLRERFANESEDKADPHDHFATSTLLRFLRARKFNVDAAQQMLANTIVRTCNSALS